jgi:predicted XRE-type DNA-binding protein
MNNQISKSCGNVFKDFGFSPELSDKLAIKSCLMAAVESYINENNLTQEQASKVMGVARPRISDAIRGKVDKFTIDALVDMLSRAGVSVAVTIENAA